MVGGTAVGGAVGGDADGDLAMVVNVPEGMDADDDAIIEHAVRLSARVSDPTARNPVYCHNRIKRRAII